MSSHTVIEQSEKPDGTIVQTWKMADGSEVQREFSYRCSICGQVGTEPFPKWAISCLRDDCLDNT